MIFQEGKLDWMLEEWAKNPKREFQTRRVKKPGEERRWMDKDRPGQIAPPDIIRPPSYTLETIIVWGRKRTWRIKHQVGRDYAIRQGRTAKGLWLDREGKFISDWRSVWAEVSASLHIPDTEAYRYILGPTRRNRVLRKQGYRELRQLITDIREERLQDIPEEDCLAEGIVKRQVTIKSSSGDHQLYLWTTFGRGTGLAYAQDAYRAMWEALGYPKGKRWEDNPTVFAYNFKLKTLGLERRREVPG